MLPVFPVWPHLSLQNAISRGNFRNFCKKMQNKWEKLIRSVKDEQRRGRRKKIKLQMINMQVRNSEKTGCFQDSHFRKLYIHCKDADKALYLFESTICKQLSDFRTHTNALVIVNLCVSQKYIEFIGHRISFQIFIPYVIKKIR